jgi:carbamoyltransferase
MHRAETLCKKYDIHCICIGGGNALNCVANGKLFDSRKYTVHAGFAPSDAGQSLGNLLFLINNYAPRLFVDPTPFQTPYIGISYSEAQLIEALQHYKGLKTAFLSRQDLAKKTADCILSGQIIGLFEKGSEMGPRALGHRSILGDPSDSSVIRKLRRIKHREDYQPFALSTQEGCIEGLHSPYMSIAADIDANAHPSFRNVIHCDGTCRIQTVAPESGLLLFDILTELKRSHCEGVINTSFNGRSKPIVESPADALCFFEEHSEMDALVIDSCFITRESE